MKKHIAALDPLILAMVHGRRGDVKEAAKQFAKAITASDAVLAIQTLEMNNQKAFEVEASAKAEAAKKAVASKKAKKVSANEFEIEGEDEPMVEEEVIESAAEDEEDEESEDDEGEDEDEESDDDEGDETFEATLASFLKKGTKATTAKVVKTKGKSAK